MGRLIWVYVDTFSRGVARVFTLKTKVLPSLAAVGEMRVREHLVFLCWAIAYERPIHVLSLSLIFPTKSTHSLLAEQKECFS